jgi:hypothetical protein
MRTWERKESGVRVARTRVRRRQLQCSAGRRRLHGWWQGAAVQEAGKGTGRIGAFSGCRRFWWGAYLGILGWMRIWGQSEDRGLSSLDLTPKSRKQRNDSGVLMVPSMGEGLWAWSKMARRGIALSVWVWCSVGEVFVSLVSVHYSDNRISVLHQRRVSKWHLLSVYRQCVITICA